MRPGCGEMRKGFTYHAESPGFETLDQLDNKYVYCGQFFFFYIMKAHISVFRLTIGMDIYHVMAGYVGLKMNM